MTNVDRDGAIVRTVRRVTSTDRRLWLVSFVVVTAMTVLWALAAPYFSGPDEASHDSRAWSVVHGEVLGTDSHLGGFRIVTVPDWLQVDHASTDCYRFDPNVGAQCFSVWSGPGEVESRTSAGAQLPFFYSPVGLPFLIASRGPGLLLVRAFGGALAAAFVASAVVSARAARSRRWLVPSLLLACPPMFLYIAGVTNPSGLEIAAAISLWVSAIVLATGRSIDTRVVVRFAVALIAVVLARQLGPLWVVVVLAFAAWIAGRERVRDLVRDRRMQLAAVAAAVSGLVWAVWILIAHPLETAENPGGRDLGPVQTLQAQVGRLWVLAEQAVGVFGYLEVRLPLFTYIVWILGTLLLVVLCWMFGRGRLAWAPAVLLAVSIGVQMAGEWRSVSTIGFFWQGRYSLPMLVGVPLLAAVGLGLSERVPEMPKRVTRAGAALVGVALFLAYFQMLRRYTVGAAGRIDIWSDPGWTPPVPALLLLVAFAIVTVVWVLLLSLAGVVAPTGVDAPGGGGDD